MLDAIREFGVSLGVDVRDHWQNLEWTVRYRQNGYFSIRKIETDGERVAMSAWSGPELGSVHVDDPDMLDVVKGWFLADG